MAVEKLVQMDGCRKPQTQKRCEAAFGIQTTKEECGLMKETKIKPELRVRVSRDPVAVGCKSGDWRGQKDEFIGNGQFHSKNPTLYLSYNREIHSTARIKIIHFLMVGRFIRRQLCSLLFSH